MTKPLDIILLIDVTDVALHPCSESLGFIVRTSRTTTTSWTTAALIISDYAAPLLAVLKRLSKGIWGVIRWAFGGIPHTHGGIWGMRVHNFTRNRKDGRATKITLL